jgi:hypothetical protein
VSNAELALLDRVLRVDSTYGSLCGYLVSSCGAAYLSGELWKY